MSDEIIRISNLDMHFSGFKKSKIQVLSDINLSINAGEVIAVVGESGCGKTTLGRLVANVLKPTNGEILYIGKDINKLKKNSREYAAYRKSVQLVHQDAYAALNPNKTILNSLATPVLEHKLAANGNALLDLVRDKLNEVGLTPPDQFLTKYPHQLSGGQRQRVLLARAMLFDTKLVVADEPVSMVDVSLRISILNLMDKMREKYGIAYIYITHDLATARYIAHNGRIIVMYLGDIVEINSIEKALKDPKHPYFYALLVSSPDPYRSIKVHELPLKSIEVPSLYNVPTGCKFHPRCPFAKERCSNEKPELRTVGEGLVACHYAGEIMFDNLGDNK